MDLYEALKAGSSAEDLLTAFHKELDAAQTRINEEEDAIANQEYLADCRADLADAILNYTEALCGDSVDDITPESIEEILIGLEKEMEGLVSASKKLDKVLADAKREGKKPVGVKVIHTETDDGILQRFLNSLK